MNQYYSSDRREKKTEHPKPSFIFTNTQDKWLMDYYFVFIN